MVGYKESNVQYLGFTESEGIRRYTLEVLNGATEAEMKEGLEQYIPKGAFLAEVELLSDKAVVRFFHVQRGKEKHGTQV